MSTAAEDKRLWPEMQGGVSVRSVRGGELERGLVGVAHEPSLTRVNVAIQFGSQLWPPSSENACSK